MIEAFKKIADLALGAKKREDEEYADFLKFYRGLVETLPADAVKIFGRCDRCVVKNGTESTWGLELTATDFWWWKNEIENFGARFKNGTKVAKNAMLTQMAKKAEGTTLPPEVRKALIALLEEAAQ